MTIGIFLYGQRTIIKARDLDRNCTEVHLPPDEESPENEAHQMVDDGSSKSDVDSPSVLYVGRGETNLSANDFSELLAENPNESFANILLDNFRLCKNVRM